MLRTLFLAALLSAVAAAPALADELKVGDVVEDLRFVDTRSLPRTLDELPGKKAYAVFFTTVKCPLVVRYLPRVVEIERAYRERGVQFLALNVGPGDSLLDVATQQVEAEAGFPFGKDFSGEAATSLGVARTTCVVVLDAEKRIRYRGRIDDQYRFGGVRPQATRDDLEEALEDVLAGKAVRVAETAWDGCAITQPQASAREAAPTWAADVAPLLNRHCVGCHRPGTEAPFSLLTYASARDNADMIEEVVVQRRMPPWFASPKYGTFANHRGLEPGEVETIAAWVRAGTPQGDPSAAPTPPEFPQLKWRIGEPDLVLRAPEQVTLPAQGYVPYKYVMLPQVFVDDTWVSGVEILPENRAALHHANLAYLRMEDGFSKPHFITGQVPGGEALDLEPGLGFMIPQGAMLVLQIHYVTVGQETTDRLSVGIRYCKAPVQKQLKHLRIGDREFAIPPGEPGHRVTASKTLPSDSLGIGMFVHMHLRGRDMKFVAHTPDGKSETLLLVPSYNFDWQLAYEWGRDAPPRFPRGTKIECVGHFDNSPFNPYNPDPKQTVKFGEQTYHEMFYGFFFYLDPDERLDVRVDPRTGLVRLENDGAR